MKEIVEVKTETSPWIKYAGMFVEDPYFDEFLEGIGAIRKKIDDERYDGKPPRALLALISLISLLIQ